MQYVLLIYQGAAWAPLTELSDEDKESIGAEYAVTNTPGGYPRPPARTSSGRHDRTVGERRDKYHRRPVRWHQGSGRSLRRVSRPAAPARPRRLHGGIAHAGPPDS
jgi:hypothetical protein